MQNVNTSAQAAEKLAAKRAKHILTGTFGLLVDGNPATVRDLSTSQINAAIEAVKFTVKGTARQQTLGYVADQVQNALVDIFEGKFIWDSTKGSFFHCLKMHTKTYVLGGAKLKQYKNEQNSYTAAQNADGEDMEMPYATGETPADVMMDNKMLIADFISKMPEKGQQFLTLYLEGCPNEEISEKMGFDKYDTFRVWKSKFMAKYNLSDYLSEKVKGEKTYKRASKAAQFQK